MARAIWSGLVLLASCCGSRAEFIDFETIPGVDAEEGLMINTQFIDTAGVTFSLEGGGSPTLAKVGNPVVAFGPEDRPLPGQGIGDYFLTDDGELSGLVSPALLVHYSTPSTAASGVILDIDFDETFTIEAFDAEGLLVDSVTIIAGDPNTGDQVATPWEVDSGESVFTMLRIKGEREAPGRFGLGFDRFNARSGLRIPGDFDNDGDVDTDDYSVWRNNFGAINDFPVNGTNPDGNGDGTVDNADYTVWRDNLGQGLATPPISTPEPAAFVLTCLCLSSLAAFTHTRY